MLYGVHMCSERKVFGSFSLSGGRFDQAEGLPISAVGEIEIYEKLIQKVAGALYKRDNPAKRKLPNGFMDQLDMRITGIQHGCVKVSLDAARVFVQQDFDSTLQPADYFDKARLSIKDAIRRIKTDGDAHKVTDFPSDAFPLLYRFGTGLKADEKISLAESDNSDSVDVDKEWREIVKKGIGDCTFRDTVIFGQVIGVNTRPKANWYTFRLFDESEQLRGNLDENRVEDFKSFFDAYDRAPLAAVSVVLKINKETGVKSIEHTYNIEKALPSYLIKKVEELSELERGWFDPPSSPGERLSQQTLDTLVQMLMVLVDHKLVEPLVSPRPDGGVEIEWQDNDYEIALSPDGTIDAYNLADDRDDDGQRSFSLADSKESIVAWLEEGEEK